MARLPALRAALCAAAALALAGAAAPAAAATEIKFGQWNTESMPIIGSNATQGFEFGLREALCELLAPEYNCSLELVPTLDDRIDWLEQGKIDVSVGALSITSTRQGEVNILRPGYLLSGCALFAPDGANPTFTEWEELAGVSVCILDGYYTTQQLQEYGVDLVVYPATATYDDLAAGVTVGNCSYLVADSTALVDGMALDTLLPWLQPLPYGVAVSLANKNSTLGASVQAALVQLATAPEGAGSSALRRLEREWLVKGGLPAEPALAQLEASVTALSACGGADSLPGTARAPGSGVAARPTQLNIGMAAPDARFEFDAGLKDALCAAVGAACTEVTLANKEERVMALQNGTVDVVINAFSVSAERAALVAFVRPLYYTAGTALWSAAPLSPAPAVWADMKGRKVCMGVEDIGVPAVEATGAVVVQLPTLSDARAAAAAGAECEALGADSSLELEGLAVVAALPPLNETPYAVAVSKDNSTLAATLSAAMVALSVGNTTGSSELQQLEKSLGLAPVPALEVSRDALTNLLSPCNTTDGGNGTAPPPPPPAPASAAQAAAAAGLAAVAGVLAAVLAV